MYVYCKEGFEVDIARGNILVKGKGLINSADLKVGDVFYFNMDTNFGNKGNYAEGVCLGWMVGDGSLVCYPISGLLLFAHNSFANDCKLIDFFVKQLDELHALYNKSYKYEPHANSKNDTTIIRSTLLGYIAYTFELQHKDKHKVPESCSKEFYQGFLQGLYSADGGVYIRDKLVYLYASEYNLLRQVQAILLKFEIYSRIKLNTKEGNVVFPNGKTSYCKNNYVLRIQGIDIFKFYNEIGFLQEIQQDKLIRAMNGYKKRTPSYRRFVGTVESIVFEAMNTQELKDGLF